MSEIAPDDIKKLTDNLQKEKIDFIVILIVTENGTVETSGKGYILQTLTWPVIKSLLRVCWRVIQGRLQTPVRKGENIKRF